MTDNKIINVNATYIGKDFVQKGVRTNKETGKEEEWKQYKARFQVDGNDNVWSFWVFNPLGKSKHKITEIEEGERYNLGYTEAQHPTRTDDNGNPIIMKKIIGISEVRAPSQEEANKVLSNANANANTNTGALDVDKFITRYKDSFAVDKQDVYHFICLYLRTMDEDLTPIMKRLKEKYQKSDDKSVVMEDV